MPREPSSPSNLRSVATWHIDGSTSWIPSRKVTTIASIDPLKWHREQWQRKTNRGCGNFNTVLELNWIVNRLLKKGDTVGISHLRQPFNREYDERWTMEYFVVGDYPVTVCCANELPTTIKKRPQTCIINTDTCDQPGTHLITFHFPQEASLEFFDSAGNTPAIYHRGFLSVLLANGPNFRYTPDRLQPAETNTLFTS